MRHATAALSFDELTSNNDRGEALKDVNLLLRTSVPALETSSIRISLNHLESLAQLMGAIMLTQLLPPTHGAQTLRRQPLHKQVK